MSIKKLCGEVKMKNFGLDWYLCVKRRENEKV